MRIRRLGWAGIELQSAGESLVIDHIQTAGTFQFFLGPEPDDFLFPETAPLAALVTHLHRDHTDVDALSDVLGDGGTVLRPPAARHISPLQELSVVPTEQQFAESSLSPESVTAGDSREIGPFTVHAITSVDGLGSPQVGWIVEADGHRVLHGGDTIWHRYWWEIADEHGPIDVACLPGNGVALDYPGQQPALDTAATLTPEQAADAAFALQTTLLPIHFNHTFIEEQRYKPVDNARERIEAQAAVREVEVTFPEVGEWRDVANVTAQEQVVP
jgi:L-ascorbate metabolism protein UlaG (beta-lactamase superfamily)